MREENFLKEIKRQNIKNLNVRYTSIGGINMQTTRWVSNITPKMLSNGFNISGVVDGWKSPNDSEILVIPDLNNVYFDPFFNQGSSKSAIVFASVIDPLITKKFNKDPRQIAMAAMSYLKTTSIATECMIAPEIEFSVFDDLIFNLETNHISHQIIERENKRNLDDVNNLSLIHI